VLIHRRLLAGATCLALLTAACGGAATPSASPAGPPASAPAASEPASEAPSASDTALPSEEPSGPDASAGEGSASDLEALLPDEAGGVTFTKVSFDGASIGAAGFGLDSDTLAPILAENGKTIADVRMAIATPTSATSASTTAVLALQVRGLDAGELIGVASGTAGGSLTPATVGGKQVMKAGVSGFSVILYTKGDILFEVLLASDAVAEAILAALP
jgi:hypothetical protein